MKLNKILVAMRGTAADEESVKLACELSKKSKAEIYVVYVIEVNRSLPLDAVIESDVNKAEIILTRAEDIAAENDSEIETDLVQAREAGTAIVDEARDRKTDLIIMGLHYKKRFGTFDIGTTIPHVLEQAPCRVLLLREPPS
jgi:nucleotide-binding universal stress UspA family protein